MKRIKLDRLVLENFKCHGYLDLSFRGEDARITGDNGTGKTSIYDAFVWLLFGRDSLGNADKILEVKPLDTKGEPRDHLAVTGVEAVLTVDGVERTFRRTYKEVWNGQKTFQGHTSDYYVDSVAVRRGEFSRQVEELFTEEQFRLLSDPRYFAGELNWQERREKLCCLAGLGDDRQLMAREGSFVSLLQALGSRDTEQLRRHLLGRVKELTQAGSDLPARISECQRTLREVEGLDFDAARRRWEQLEKRREDLTAQLFAPEEENYRRYQQSRQRLENTRQRRASLVTENLHYHEALEQLESRLNQVRQRQFQGERCGVCGQKLPAELLEDARQRFQRERSRELSQLESRKERLLREQTRAKEALEAVEAELAGEEAVALSPVTDPAEPVRRELEVLRRELRDLREVLDQEALLTYSRERMEQLRQQEKQSIEQLEKCRQLLQELERFTAYKAGLLERSVNSRFTLAQFRLFREKIGGGLEERCDVLLEGVPYVNVNNGGKLRLGLDIIRTLSRAWELELPVFIDNAEAVTYMEAVPGQRIRLAVAPGALQIEEDR